MGNSGSWYAANRQKVIDRAVAWKKANPDKVRRIKRKARGIKDATGEVKTGPCEVCCKVRQLRFDHSHETGFFRGWLCGPCNIALGWFEKIIREGLDQKFLKYLQNP